MLNHIKSKPRRLRYSLVITCKGDSDQGYMGKMDVHTRYLKVLRDKYLNFKTREGKPRILDEYCNNAGQARKYVISYIRMEEMPG